MDLAVQENNLVIHPKHYNTEGRPECWEEMEEIFGKDAVMIFDILSAYKYYYRAGEKEGNPPEQDMAKIENYMNHAKTHFNDSNYYVRDCYIKMLSILREGDKNDKY